MKLTLFFVLVALFGAAVLADGHQPAKVGLIYVVVTHFSVSFLSKEDIL